MATLIQRIFEWLASIERSLVVWVVSFESWTWALTLGLSLAILVAGVRLGKYSHPGRARWSLFVRHTTTVLLVWPAGLALVGLILFMGLTAVLTLSLGWQTAVWEVAKFQILGAMGGLCGGVLLGGVCYYWLIPGLERPEAAGVHERVPCAVQSYDPEEYFCV